MVVKMIADGLRVISPARVAIVILNWNGSDLTLECVRSVMDLDYDNFHVVVCDNASRSADVENLRRLESISSGDFAEFLSLRDAKASNDVPKICLIHTGANLGYAGGVNVGLRYALGLPGTDYCWVLNNDTEVSPDSLVHMLKRFQGQGNIGICGATLMLHHRRSEVQCFGGASCNPKTGRSRAIGFRASSADIPVDFRDIEPRLAYVNGACMLVSRPYMEDVGLMDESYFLYSEEHDWAERGIRAGYRLGYAPKSLVFHRHGATIGTSDTGGSELSLFYLFRNKLAFTRKFFRGYYFRVFAVLAFDAFKFALRGQFGKAKSAYRGLLAEPTMRPF